MSARHPDADVRVIHICASNHGVVTRDQALRAGLTPAQIRHRVTRRRWEQLRPGVYRIAGGVPDPWCDLAAAVRAGAGTASHRSAAALLGLLDEQPPVPELTTSVRGAHHHEGVRLHRTDDLPSFDTTHVSGLVTTNAVRTIIDLGARLDPVDLLRVTDRALRSRSVNIDRLIARFLQLSRQGRDGTQTTRCVLEQLDPAMAPAESDLETLLVQVIRSAGLPAPERQLEVRIDQRTFRLDVAYPEQMVAIEADGFAVHGSRDAFEFDRERQNLIVNAGWRILRFTWRQICQAPDTVVAAVRQALGGRPPHGSA